MAAGAQVVADRPGDDREDDVVDGAPVLVLDRLQRVELGADEGDAAVGADLDVEGGRGRGHAGADHLARVADAAQDLARAAQRGAHAADDLARAGGALAQGVAEQFEVGRLRARRPLGRAHGRVGRLLLDVEEDGGDVDAGDAVDEGVVALADDREAAAVEALDQPQLPERLAAVELLGEDPRRQVAQLLLGAGSGQRGLPHVVLEVEVGVVDPDRPALAEGDEAQLLAEAGDQVQPRGDVVAELGVTRRRPLEDAGRGDVHVRAGTLHVEEGGVESSQPVSAHG